MPRNLDRRVEIAFPVLDPGLQAQVREILEIQLADTVKARRILPDGRSVRVRAEGRPPLRSQERLYELTAGGRSHPLDLSRPPTRAKSTSAVHAGFTAASSSCNPPWSQSPP